MQFQYRYSGQSAVAGNASSMDIAFAPDTLRDPTFFTGKLRRRMAFREAISALHDIVISDLRYQPRDLTEFKAWLKRQEDVWAGEALAHGARLKTRINELSRELDEMNRRQTEIMRPFHIAQRRYWKYLYHQNYRLWFILDPVVTVHPDELFFECFSRDESSYGKLSCSYNVFEDVREFRCGTTNIDYSDTLYGEFQKIRDYKETRFQVDPGGFDVQTTDEDVYREVKIDLPDSWVRGFLQVSSAMTMAAVRLDLDPMDLHNFCFMLRRRRERQGPRAMRYRLSPGKPVKVIFEPWNQELVCHRSIFQGDSEHEIRVWGRRRIHMLERLLPLARSFTIHLLGSGMPSFYTADLGDMTFTLGLSGWTANDWSRMGNFDLLAPRKATDHTTRERVFLALKQQWRESADSLANRLGLERDVVLGALSAYTQAGRAIYDLTNQVFRVRELSREPLPLDKLRFANEREEEAVALMEQNCVHIWRQNLSSNATEISGQVAVRGAKSDTRIVIDSDDRMTEGSCTCNFYRQNKLFKGPCACMLALRLAWQKGCA